jgi:hypothetical protein
LNSEILDSKQGRHFKMTHYRFVNYLATIG